MNDDNSRGVFIPFIYVNEPLNLITPLDNKGLSSDQKEELTLDVGSMSWELHEFMSWKVGEWLVVRTNTVLGKCLTEDLLMERTSLQVSQQIQPSSKPFRPHVKEELNLSQRGFFWLRQHCLSSDLVTNHIHSKLFTK